jgi:tRNA threonylcarbamoyladenosine biosynthesis protein TsaE
MQLLIHNLSDLPVIARRLLDALKDYPVWLFYGEMGAGKTTLIKAICEELGVEDQASSPTFSIVNEYATTRGPVFHFDFYRIKSEQEAMDLGYEEYFYSGHPCFVEWPELIPSLIPDNAIAITIRLLPNGIRELSVAAPKA